MSFTGLSLKRTRESLAPSTLPTSSLSTAKDALSLNLPQVLSALEELKPEQLTILSSKDEYLRVMANSRRNSDNRTSSSLSTSDQEHDPRVIDIELESYVQVYEQVMMKYLDNETKIEFVKNLMTVGESEDEEEEEEGATKKKQRLAKSSAYETLKSLYSYQQVKELEEENKVEEITLQNIRREAERVQQKSENEAIDLVRYTESALQLEKEMEAMVKETIEMEKEAQQLEYHNLRRRREIESKIGSSLIRELYGQNSEEDKAADEMDYYEKVLEVTKDYEQRVEALENQQSRYSHLSTSPRNMKALGRKLEMKKQETSNLESEILLLKQKRDSLNLALEQNDNTLSEPKSVESKEKVGKTETEEGEYGKLGEKKFQVFAEKPHQWYINVLPLLAKLTGISQQSIKVRAQGPHQTVIKFSRTIGSVDSPTRPNMEDCVTVTFELVIDNVKENLSQAKICWVARGENKKVFSQKEIRELENSVIQQTSGLGERSPSYYVNLVCQKLRQKMVL